MRAVIIDRSSQFLYFNSMEKSPLVNYGKKDEILQIFPSTPLNKFEFADMQIQTYDLPAHEAPEHLSAHDVIVVFHSPIPLIKRVLGDKFKDESIRPGDIVISPAKTPHSACWNSEASFTLVLIKPGCIANYEPELINPGKVELLKQFACSDSLLGGIGGMLRSEIESHQQLDKLYCESIAQTLILHLRKNYSCTTPGLIEYIPPLSDIDLCEVIDYVHTHLDQKFGITDLATLLSMSGGYFSRRFKKSTGQSLTDYVIDCRLKKATHLLASTDLDLAAIARQSGFTNQFYLSKTFSDHFSITPCRYRKSL
jgi:AraC family transcriptional regulator